MWGCLRVSVCSRGEFPSTAASAAPTGEQPLETLMYKFSRGRSHPKTPRNKRQVVYFPPPKNHFFPRLIASIFHPPGPHCLAQDAANQNKEMSSQKRIKLPQQVERYCPVNFAPSFSLPFPSWPSGTFPAPASRVFWHHWPPFLHSTLQPCGPPEGHFMLDGAQLHSLGLEPHQSLL